MPQPLSERGRLLEAPGADTTGTRRPIQIITPGWGSSGYYSPAVLERAASNRVIPAGTHMYFDHASGSERADRPERSVRDIAAVLTEDATWDGERLIAEAHFFGSFAEHLAELAPYIGVSISGSATDITIGEAEGRTGPIIEDLAHVASVDFVTHAGRGGRVLEVLESGRPLQEARNIGQWVESRIHRDFTIVADDMAGDGRLTREERIGLSSAIGDALAAFVASLEANQPQLYTRDIWDDPQDSVAAAIEAAHNVTATRPGSTTNTQESKEDTMPQIEEAQLRQLEADAGRVPTLESERDTAVSERDALRDQLATERRTTRARTLIGERAHAAQVTFTPLEERGLLADLPTGDDGALDEAAFTTAVDEAAAAVAETRGAGTVTGFGGTPTGTTTITEADIDAAVGGIFGRKGA